MLFLEILFSVFELSDLFEDRLNKDCLAVGFCSQLSPVRNIGAVHCDHVTVISFRHLYLLHFHICQILSFVFSSQLGI